MPDPPDERSRDDPDRQAADGTACQRLRPLGRARPIPAGATVALRGHAVRPAGLRARHIGEAALLDPVRLAEAPGPTGRAVAEAGRVPARLPGVALRTQPARLLHGGVVCLPSPGLAGEGRKAYPSFDRSNPR